MTLDDDLERAIGDWLLRKEVEPDLLPGSFANSLPEPVREPFLRELEGLAEIDGMATLAPPSDLPRRYGDFRVLRELGRGAMGAVYDAEQVSTGRRVALKVMHAHVAKDLHSASRFQREARTAAALRHPGIVGVLGFGETDGAWWLAMERLDGRSLQRLLAALGEARDVDHARATALLHDKKTLAAVLADAADALEFAHRNGVVHRDVKPANLMYDGRRIVVLDFGLATACEADAAALTRTGDFLGTPLYMAPEQAMGAENGTPRSDVYALGAVLYECLAGRPPVPPGPLATVIDWILHHDPVEPRRLRQGVPEELSRIAMQCLEKEPARRYATAAALADDLRRFVDGSGVLARHSGVLSRSLRRLRRRPVLAALLAAVCLLVPTALITWKSAIDADQHAKSLQEVIDTARIDELLGDAPERVTVFGGASLRFYARLGLGEQLDAGASRPSPRAEQALQLAEALAQRRPDDVEVLRTRACARMDVGCDLQRTDEAIAALVAHKEASASDRMLAAVHARQQGREAEAQRLHRSVPAGDASAAFWLAFWHQDEQDHAAAIAAFTHALDHGSLRTELRYQALLHRGWCRTCPDTAELEQAKDDLLQAAALRPRYGTALLLWAALRCLGARQPADLAEPVAAVEKVLGGAEPWVHVLTARVLLALAEGGTVQSGPVSFGAEFSPIAVMPLPNAIAMALAGKGLELLDGVLAGEPSSFEAAFHRITALALLGRHEDALAAADRLHRGAPRVRHAVIDLQRARVLLAGGRTPAAFVAVGKALDEDTHFAASWRFRAELCAHVGDAGGQLEAIERAIALLADPGCQRSVFPDATAVLPELQFARARVLADLGRRADAIEVLQRSNFGGALAGEFSPRVRCRRHELLRRFGVGVAEAAAAPAVGSPLRWLVGSPARIMASDANAALMAMRRDWLPAVAWSDALPSEAWLAEQRQVRGLQSPSDVAAAPLRVLLANAPALVAVPGVAEELLSRTGTVLEREPDNAEARVLRALVFYLTTRAADAAAVLATAVDEHSDDLRMRYLLAVVARDTGDQRLLRLALRRGSTLLGQRELDAAAMVLPLREPVPGVLLLETLR